MIGLDLAFDAEALTLNDAAPDVLMNESLWAEDLRRWIETIRKNPAISCPSALRVADEVSLGLRFTDDATIRELNGVWRQRDEVTDVLSFASLDGESSWPDAASVELASVELSSVELGDIVISVETARRQAEEHQHSLGHELRWLVSHGLLHLLGWDHPDDASLEAMLSQQERLLENGGNVQAHGARTMGADL